ncbi:MAG: TetR family transcriptional regulator C-terminal domain-containing protein, partial [Anaerolineae bacterium]|nr:TetR family transcriptional regulator C-terminal domain-containing protein [Anaerolineae bacterium]
DKYDLMQQYTADVYALTSEDELAGEKTGQMDDSPSGLVNLLAHIQEYADFYRVMLGPKGDPGFTESFRKNIENRFRFLFTVGQADQTHNPTPIELRIKYISYAGIGAIRWWLEDDQPCTIEQLTNWMSYLSTACSGLSFPPKGDTSPVDEI